jgi:hypothetical protein
MPLDSPRREDTAASDRLKNRLDATRAVTQALDSWQRLDMFVIPVF